MLHGASGPIEMVLPVAIIGAGLAGLQAGRLLHEAGLRFRIFEVTSPHRVVREEF